MQTYTPFQYLLIDAANQFGLDKELFETRIDWAKKNLPILETLYSQAPHKEHPLFIKAVQAIRTAQAGEATGHLVGLDGVCSGIQIMSVLTGCKAGAEATGLVDPNKRSDAYAYITEAMNRILASSGASVNISRKAAKDATMTLE